MVKYAGASAGVKEILVLAVAAVVLIMTLPYLLKMLVKSTGEQASELVGDVINAPAKAIDAKLNTQAAQMEEVAHREAGTYKKYFESLPLISQVAVQAGNIITPSPILEAAAAKGYAVGAEYVDRRGTLSVQDVPLYNSLTEQQRLQYNEWATAQNVGKTGFFYAPSVQGWIDTEGKSFFNVYTRQAELNAMIKGLFGGN